VTALGERVDEELAELADAHGVLVRYLGADQREVEVDRDVVVAVLGQLGVDATTPVVVRQQLAALRARTAPLPTTVVVVEGEGFALPEPGTVRLEDGAELSATRELPADLPLGYHRLITEHQDVALLVVPAQLPAPTPAWGWMLQLYALRSAGSWGIGDYADLAEFAHRSATELDAGLLLVNPVQAIAPVTPIQRSPYSPASRRFANPLYLRVTDLPEFAAADPDTRRAVTALRPDAERELIDYDEVWRAKLAALELLHPLAGPQPDPEPALRDFATWCALAERHGPDWRTWPADLRHPDNPAVAAARADLAPRVAFHSWLQRACEQQLDQARRHAGLRIVHDLPVGVDPGGADAWALQDVFASDVTVGAPPDAFSQQGQDWRLPPWRPDKLAETGYAPFRDVLRSVLRHADGVRVDHVAGLWRLWWVPPGEPASRGAYVRYDPRAMLGVLALEAHRAGAVVVGEDLGTVLPEVTRTLHQRGMLSTAVLWFQRDYQRPGQPVVPPRDWPASAMASITTHDLPTAAGYLRDEQVRVRAERGLLTRSDEAEYAAAAAERAGLLDLLAAEGLAEPEAPEAELVRALHGLLARSPCAVLLTAPQDVLGELRQPNLPGTVDEYPNWRIPLPVTLDEFFADPRVADTVAELRRARPRR
jgi:4-alpha-glucanotransferase